MPPKKNKAFNEHKSTTDEIFGRASRFNNFNKSKESSLSGTRQKGIDCMSRLLDDARRRKEKKELMIQ